MPENDLAKLPLTQYLDGSLEAAELKWVSDMSLKEGTVLVLYHPKSEWSFVFESLEPKGNKQADGLLTIINENDARVISERQEARIKLLHPAVALAQANTPYAEFIIPKQEGTARNILVPVKYIDVMFSEELARRAQQVRLQRELRKPFKSQTARNTLHSLVAFYESLSTSSPDHTEAVLLRQIAAQLLKDFPAEPSL